MNLKKERKKGGMGEAVKVALNELFRKKSFAAISRSSGVASSYLCNLNKGVSQAENMTLATVQKIFPSARIEISMTEDIPFSRAEKKLIEIFRSVPEELRIEAVLDFSRYSSAPKTDGLQAIAECMSDEEAQKTFEILKIVFPQYAPKHKE